MKNEPWLLGRYINTSIKAQLQYKTSFLLDTLGQFLMIIIEFIGVAALFRRFGNLLGWQLAEAALFYGQIHISFALADMLGRGFDLFGGMVRAGDFDRILLRPRSTIVQLMGFDFALKRLGRITQGLVVLIWGTFTLGLTWTPLKIALLLTSMLGSSCLFLGLFIIQATIAFRTIETLEIMNTMTYGGTFAAQYPLSIYRPVMRRFFTFIVPLAGVNYFPILTILDKQDAIGTPLWLGYFTPLGGLLFLLATLFFWRMGVRRYQSTGS